MEKFNKLSLPVVILIASVILGGFFYASQVNKQKSIERQQQIKIEQEKQGQLAKDLKEQQEKEKAEQAKEEATQALDTCIATAEENYSHQWLIECKAQGRLNSSCIALVDITREEYIEQNKTPFEEYSDPLEYLKDLENLLINRNKKLAECSCSLPLSLADRINDSLKSDKDECFKKYPQK